MQPYFTLYEYVDVAKSIFFQWDLIKLRVICCQGDYPNYKQLHQNPAIHTRSSNQLYQTHPET